MNKKTIYTRVLVFALLFFSALFSVNAQIQLQKHVVKSGETLYRLSIQYGIAVDQILQYNPGLSSNNLQAGNTVLIPRFNPNEKTETLEPIAIKTTHKVKRKETLYSISKKYEITIDELKAANPEMFAANYELKKGTKINIPYHSVKPAVQQHNQASITEKPTTPTANGYSTVKIAIMLPFTSNAAGSKRCVEFYRGFLLAVDKMKDEGKNVEIYAYNEPKAQSSIITILESIRLKRVHLLVGPLYFDHFGAVSRFSNTNKIKTLVPFSSKIEEIKENEYLYLLNAPEEEKYEFSSNLFVKNFPSQKVVFVSTNSKNERTFTRHLRSKLLTKGYQVDDISIASSDQQIRSTCSSKHQTIFVPDGSKDSDFEEVMKCLIQFKKRNPQFNTAFFAYPEWQHFAYNRRSDMHIVDTYLYTNAFFNPWSATTNELKQKYTQWFKTDIIDTTPRMFMLGYDTGLTFINGLYTYGRHFTTQDQKLPLQQSDIVFKKISKNGGYISDSMWFIHYRTDYQIEKVAEK